MRYNELHRAENRPWWAARDANAYRGHWKDTFPPQIMDIVNSELEQILNGSEKDIFDLQKNPVEKNRLAAVVVVRPEDQAEFLPHSLKALVEQMNVAGVYGDIYIIINRGGERAAEYLRQNGADIKKGLGVSDAIYAEVRREGAGDNRKMPGKIYLDPNEVVDNKKDIRLFFINQEDSAVNSGKIAGLRDIYQYLFEVSTQYHYRPEFIFAMDAETTLYPYVSGNKTIDLESKEGLAKLIESTNGGKRLVGAKIELVPFKDGRPDWNAPVSPMSRFISALHGETAPCGYQTMVKYFTRRRLPTVNDIPIGFLAGGATLGDYCVVTGITRDISQKYPGLRVEDMLLSIVARALGVELYVDTAVIHANRCPPHSDSDLSRSSLTSILSDRKKIINGEKAENIFTNGEEQTARWLCGNEGLRRIFGDEIFSFGTEPNSTLKKYCIFSIGDALGSDDNFTRLQKLMFVARSARLIKLYYTLHPDDPKHGDGNWNNG
ncbi:hypothetical protein JXA85_07665 [Candidatus Woesearchaeota archaeon]|nr:hypothetical protein [Candidatus Woesearchaeota archaeon]